MRCGTGSIDATSRKDAVICIRPAPRNENAAYPRSVLLPTLSAASLNSEALMVVTDGQVGKQDFALMPSISSDIPKRCVAKNALIRPLSNSP